MTLKSGDRLQKPEGCSDEMYVNNCTFHDCRLTSSWLTVYASSLMYQWVPGNLIKELTLRYIGIPFQGMKGGGGSMGEGKNTPSRFMLRKLG